MSELIKLVFDNGKILPCYHATSIEERQAGLTAYKDIPENHGLLFVYDRPETPCIWNSGVPFDIEILYFSLDDLSIKNVSFAKKDSKDIVMCPSPVKLVLEIKAGTMKALGLSIGSKIVDITDNS